MIDRRVVFNVHWLVIWEWWNGLEKIVALVKMFLSLLGFGSFSLLFQNPIQFAPIKSR